MPHAKKEGRHRVNTCMTRKPEKVKKFIRVLEEALPCPANINAAQRWEYLRDTIYNAASLTFGKKQAKTADWFEAHLDEIQPFIDERRAFASYKSSPSERTLQILRAAQNKVQQISRRCAHEFWLQMCNHIQVCADTGNLKGMYDGIKQAIGPVHSRTAIVQRLLWL